MQRRAGAIEEISALTILSDSSDAQRLFLARPDCSNRPSGAAMAAEGPETALHALQYVLDSGGSLPPRAVGTPIALDLTATSASVLEQRQRRRL